MKIITTKYLQLLDEAIGLENLRQMPEHWCIVEADLNRPTDCQPEHCIVLVPPDSPQKMIAYAESSHASQFISPTHPYFRQQLRHALDFLAGQSEIFNDPLSFLLGPSLRLADDSIPEIRERRQVVSSDEKSSILDELMLHLQSHRRVARLTQSTLSICDELLMNALYDAPRIATEKASTRSDSRSAQLLWGFNAQRLAFAVIDQYGTLNVDHLISRLHRVYSTGTAQAMNMGPGGAGIGMRMVMDQCSALYLAVHQNHQTIVGGLLNAGKGRLTAASEQKSLHILIKKSL